MSLAMRAFILLRDFPELQAKFAVAVRWNGNRSPPGWVLRQDSTNSRQTAGCSPIVLLRLQRPRPFLAAPQRRRPPLSCRSVDSSRLLRLPPRRWPLVAAAASRSGLLCPPHRQRPAAALPRPLRLVAASAASAARPAAPRHPPPLVAPLRPLRPVAPPRR